MKRIIVTAAVAALLGGGAMVANATPGPGNGNNTFGLCTAYFAGSQTGQDHKHSAPPFAALEAAASAANKSVADYCAANGQHPGNSGK